ncbi:hypothetical protein OGAPHI_003858 [Ogataea philodendri]|uniref:Uncharacterized protein n=1 Tax=Ogataea philodendri TaxID=1378263 RepID=A0A9P8P5N4_9ASCO|nr:uncharacterized protein OGAPHI_003858 [Ogataea philodendri]KAH3665670.1 hypothetical protein OGAPHI_003858 [Ogataea philodendri]
MLSESAVEIRVVESSSWFCSFVGATAVAGSSSSLTDSCEVCVSIAADSWFTECCGSDRLVTELSRPDDLACSCAVFRDTIEVASSSTNTVRDPAGILVTSVLEECTDRCSGSRLGFGPKMSDWCWGAVKNGSRSFDVIAAAERVERKECMERADRIDRAGEPLSSKQLCVPKLLVLEIRCRLPA